MIADLAATFRGILRALIVLAAGLALTAQIVDVETALAIGRRSW